MLEVVKKDIDNNGKAHAFLIGNVSFSCIKDELDKLITNKYFNGKGSIFVNPDVIIVNEMEVKTICKDEINVLKSRIINRAQFSSNKVYIIINAEKLNVKSSNILLKQLEEPEDNIYAFLLTKNFSMVLPTIKSRCKNYFISSDTMNDDIYSKDYEKILLSTLNFINNVEKSKKDSFICNALDVKDRESFILSLNLLEYFYKDCLNYRNNKKMEYFVNNESDVKRVAVINNNEKILKKLLVINDIIKDMNYNLSISLSIDKLIIEFWRN
ncbi:MAG: hypothetical protein RR228_02060 [Bacilli bacterium]